MYVLVLFNVTLRLIRARVTNWIVHASWYPASFKLSDSDFLSTVTGVSRTIFKLKLQVNNSNYPMIW